MRILSVVLSLLVTASLAFVAVSYLEERVGQTRIAVQDSWTGADEPQGYQGYGQTASVVADRDSSAGR
jgi:hypothetical protein